MLRNFIFLFAIVFTSINFIYSQKNIGFEEWSTDFGVETPDNWITLNYLILLGNDTSCKKNQNAHSGLYSALLKPIFINSIGDTTNGILFQTIDFNQRPKSFCIYYKYSGKSIDSSFINISFYKGSINPINIIGNASFYFHNMLEWSEACSNINWLNNQNPDTLEIKILTSDKNKQDSLLVDDLDFKYSSSIIKNPILNNYSLFYFNQKSKELIFTDDNFKFSNKNIKIFNNLGQQILKIETLDDVIQINSITTGLYYINIYCNGEQYIEIVFI